MSAIVLRRSMARDITFMGDLAHVPLTQGLVAVIDARDAPLVAGRYWAASKAGSTFYAITNVRLSDGRKSTLKMHRVIIGDTAAAHVDHIDRNGLNNRRANLRAASCAENGANRPAQKNNRSGFKGVSFDMRSGKWRAEISKNGRRVSLGLHKSAELASAAYVEAAASMHGKFGGVA